MASFNLLQELNKVLVSLQLIFDELANKKPTADVETKLGEVTRLSQKIKRRLGTRKNPRRRRIQKSNDNPALAELQERLALIRDRVRGVAKQGQAGFYLYGRTGTSKTYTILQTLDSLGIPYHYQNGHLTPMGLFELFEEHQNKIIVLDDVGKIFEKPAAESIFLAALGSLPNGKREIRYKRQGKTVKIDFTGGLIAVSNIELHGDALMDAIKSRVQVLKHDPTDQQIAALMRDISTRGFVWMGHRMGPKECEKVCHYLLERFAALDLRPDVRILIDKAFPDYLLWKTGESETHWKDLINSALEDRLVELKHPSDVHIPSKREEESAELDMLEKICRDHASHEDRLEKFMEQANKSKRTYHRRMRQLRTMRRLPK